MFDNLIENFQTRYLIFIAGPGYITIMAVLLSLGIFEKETYLPLVSTLQHFIQITMNGENKDLEMRVAG